VYISVSQKVLKTNRQHRWRLWYNFSMSSFLRNGVVLGFLVAAIFISGTFVANGQTYTPPSNLSITQPTSCEIDLSWTQGQFPYTYIQADRVGFLQACSFSFPYSLATSVLNGTSFIHAPVSSTARYCYRVQSRESNSAVCGAAPNRCSSWLERLSSGAIASSTTPTIPPPSVATFTLAIARDGGARTTLVWDTSTRFSDRDHASYRIYRDGTYVTSTPAFTTTTDGLGATVYVPIGLFDDVDVPLDALHTYTVQAAQSATGCLVGSESVSAQSAPITVPRMPFNVVPEYLPTSTEGVVGDLNITWVDGNASPSGVTTLFVYRREISEAASSLRKDNIPVGTMLYAEDPTSLVLDSTYEYQLRQKTEFTTPYLRRAYSDFTPAVQVSVANGPQDVQARLYYVNPTNETADILLSWRNSVENENYVVQRSTDGGAHWAPIGGPGYTNSEIGYVFLYRDTDVPLSTLYQYRVSVSQGGTLSDSVKSGTVNTRIEKILYGFAYSSIGPGFTPSAPATIVPSPKRSVGFLETLGRLVPQTKAAFAPLIPRVINPAPATLVSIPTSDGGAGWINFSSDFPGNSGTHHYSVQVDTEGVLSGAAWAAIGTPSGDDGFEYGWLSFNRDDLRGCMGQSELVACTARMNLTTGQLSGWARFIGFKNLAGADQWYDGWVSLASFGANTHPYGSAFDSSLGKLIGTAWSAFRNTLFDQKTFGLGWIAMSNDACRSAGGSVSCDVRYTTRTNAPVITNVRVNAIGEPLQKIETDNSVTPPTETVVGRWEGDPFCASSTKYAVLWQYTGSKPAPDDLELELVPTGGSGKTVFLTSSTMGTPPGGYTFTGVSGFPVGNNVGTLDYGKAYVARVRAGEIMPPTNEMVWSAWTESGAFVTPTHYYPLVDFSSVYKGVNLSAQYSYEFDGAALSLDRSAGSGSVYPTSVWAWNWDFGNAVAGFGDPATATGNPGQTAFSSSSTYPVKLTVDDGGGGVCSYTQLNVDPNIGTDGPLRRRIWVEP